MKRAFKQWLPLVFWIALIFGLSSIPALSTDYKDLPQGFDKLVHFTEYAILAVLFYRLFRYNNRRKWWFVSASVLLVGVSVAALDEMYQSFIPGRDSSILDVLADSAGIAAGTVVAMARYERKVPKTDESGLP